MINIDGPWPVGYALAVHTLSSRYLGDDENGRPQFETKRSEPGELLYKAKYHADRESADKIVQLFLNEGKVLALLKNVHVIITIPSNKRRSFEHVKYITDEIAKNVNIEVRHDVLKKSINVEIKLLSTNEKRKLESIMICEKKNDKQDIKVILFDDLFDSGKTMVDAYNELNTFDYNVEGILTITRNRIAD